MSVEWTRKTLDETSNGEKALCGGLNTHGAVPLFHVFTPLTAAELRGLKVRVDVELRGRGEVP